MSILVEVKFKPGDKLFYLTTEGVVEEAGEVVCCGFTGKVYAYCTEVLGACVPEDRFYATRGEAEVRLKAWREHENEKRKQEIKKEMEEKRDVQQD